MGTLEEDKGKWLDIQNSQKENVQNAWGNTYVDRINKLNRLKAMVEEHEELWFKALKLDLGKSEIDTYSSEIATVLNEIDFMKKNLKELMKSEKKINRTVVGKVEYTVSRKPYGSVLIISPWNYPLQLTFVPLIGAIAAGNNCFVKPSEKSQVVSHLMNQLISHYFKSEEIFVIEGNAETAQALVGMTWDHIFFTGSLKVGQEVYETASKKVTPVTLELGGKNHCIVDETNCTRETVRKIIWGKFTNAGQTCIAPDTVYVQESVKNRFKQLAIETIQEFYGRDPKESENYGRLIDNQHFKKIRDYLTQGEIIYGGESDETTLYVGPTLIESTDKDSPIATEEIFGPVLPLIPYYSLQKLLEELQKQDSPLVTYLFTKDSARIEKVDRLVRTGAVIVNQVILFAADPAIPFGGVGKSGFGRYHGRHSYDTFTFEKVLYHQTADYANKLIFPPYSIGAFKFLKSMRKWLS